MHPEAMGATPIIAEGDSLLEEKGAVSAVLYGTTSQRGSSHT